MGYASPRQNINQSLGVINEQIAANQTKMDVTFANLRNMYIGQIEDNQAIEAAEAERRAMGVEKWDKIVADAQEGVEGGYNEVVRNFVMDKGDEYYDLIGDNSKEAVRRRRELESIPTQLSKGQGAFMANEESYLKAIEIEKGKPGSISEYNSDAATRSFAAEGGLYNYAGISITEQNGKIDWHNKSSIDGKTHTMSNDAYVQNSLKGQSGINTVGDPVAYMTELGKGVKAETNYDQVTTVNDQTNPEEHTKVVKMENEKLANAMAQPGLYKSALANQKEMRRMFPTLVSSVEQAAKDKDHPNHDQARKLMYGDDMKPGGVNIEGGAQNADFIAEQEGAYTPEQIDEAGVDANAMLGQWVSDPTWPNRKDMDEIAMLGFQLNLPENFYVEDKTTQIDKLPAWEETAAGKAATLSAKTQRSKAYYSYKAALAKGNVTAANTNAVLSAMVQEAKTDDEFKAMLEAASQLDEGQSYVIKEEDGISKVYIRTRDPENWFAFLPNDVATGIHTSMSQEDADAAGKSRWDTKTNIADIRESGGDDFLKSLTEGGSGDMSKYNCAEGETWDATQKKCIKK